MIFLQGDAITVLATLPSASVNCCVTSPPYFGLRSYLPDDHPDKAREIGLDRTPEAFVARLVAVFREVRRVLRDDGTLWLNMGDSYAATTKGSSGKGEKQLTNVGTLLADRRWRVPDGLKQKDLIGIPWRLAFALQADGWYLRQDIIWHKPNPMPESVTDRCTKAHEYIFLLSKSERYYFDKESIMEPCSEDMQRRARLGHTRGGGGKIDRSRCDSDSIRGDHSKKIDVSKGRSKRSVWSIPVASFKGAHYATFPPELIRPAILAGCPPDGVVLDPFGGSGTTAQVATEEGRKSILIDIDARNEQFATARLAKGVENRGRRKNPPSPASRLDDAPPAPVEADHADPA